MGFSFLKKRILQKHIFEFCFVLVVALFLLISGSKDTTPAKEEFTSAPQWVSSAGSGISIPACSSSSPSTSCTGNTANGVIAWNWEDHAPGCDKAIVSIPGIGLYDNQPCSGSLSLNNLTSNANYTYYVTWYDLACTIPGEFGCVQNEYVQIEQSTGSLSTPDCSDGGGGGGGGGAPLAEAGISMSGASYGQSITVTRGVPVVISLSADRDVTGDGLSSRDPDGWTDPAKGVSSGGKCEWNSDLNQGAPTFEQLIQNPASASSCNVSLGSRTFNDPPGVYTYNVLKITDAENLESNVSFVRVVVTSEVSASIDADPNVIPPGGTSILTWDTEGFVANECSIDHGIGVVTPDGNRTVSPPGITTYTILCSNGVDSASASATVIVLTIPTIEEVPPR